MRLSYSYCIGRECTENAIGKEWTFSRWKRTVWIDLAAEAKRLMPNPITVAMAAIEEATLSDARVLAGLAAQDADEAKKAAEEKRQPVMMAPQYVPISSALTDRAYAAARRYLSPGSPEMMEFLESHEGASFLFYLLLKPKHPEITIDEAYDVYWDLGVNNGADGRKTFWQIVNTCNGKSAVPAKNGESPA